MSPLPSFKVLTPDQLAEQIAQQRPRAIPPGSYRASLSDYNTEPQSNKSGSYYSILLEIIGGIHAGRKIKASLFVKVEPSYEGLLVRTNEWIVALSSSVGIAPGSNITLDALHGAIVQVDIKTNSGGYAEVTRISQATLTAQAAVPQVPQVPPVYASTSPEELMRRIRDRAALRKSVEAGL